MRFDRGSRVILLLTLVGCATTPSTYVPPGHSKPLTVAEPPAPPAEKPKAEPQWIWPIGAHDGHYVKGHRGMDFPAHGAALSVVAAADGVVTYVGAGIKSYGLMVIIKHEEEFVSVYAHDARVFVKEGETVKRGQKIAETQTIAQAHGAPWHFEIRAHGKPISPDSIIKSRSP